MDLKGVWLPVFRIKITSFPKTSEANIDEQGDYQENIDEQTVLVSLLSYFPKARIPGTCSYYICLVSVLFRKGRKICFSFSTLCCVQGCSFNYFLKVHMCSIPFIWAIYLKIIFFFSNQIYLNIP